LLHKTFILPDTRRAGRAKKRVEKRASLKWIVRDSARVGIALEKRRTEGDSSLELARQSHQGKERARSR